MDPTVHQPAVRRATAEDAAIWRRLRHRALAEAPDAFGSTLEREREWGEEVYAERLRQANSALAFLDADAVGMGAGFEDLPGWFHIVAIWVDPRARGRGINARILEALVGRADELGLRVHIDVADGNDAARRSYERFGFAPTGETHPIREGEQRITERMVLPAGLSPG